MMTHEWQVSNIHCAGCVKKIQQALMKEKGVMGVTVDPAHQLISVTGLALERKNLVNIVRKLGYPPEGQNRWLHKAQSLITCTFDRITELA